MNCKPGDFAIIIGADSEEEKVDLGKPVYIRCPGHSYAKLGDTRHYWECDTLGQSITVYNNFDTYNKSLPGEVVDIADMHLRPLRPDEGEDEILRLVGKPNKVTS